MAKKRKPYQSKPSQEQETHQWDRLLKTLTKANPQDLVSWILKGAVYQGELSLELLKKPPIFADLLYTIKWRGQKMILHVEFQRENDQDMGRRAWQYNCLASIHTELPVHSVVIYLLKTGDIIDSPYEVILPTEFTAHRFYFQNIKLWEIPREVLKQQKLPGLLPLLPLTKEGKSQAVVEEVIEGLEQSGRHDLLPLACLFAAYTFDTELEQQWLIERFTAMQGSFNLEDNYIYREMVKWAEEKSLKRGLEQGMELGFKQGEQQGLQLGLKQGEQQGLQKGLKQGAQKGLQLGLKQGEQKTLEQLVVRFVELHFPDLVPLAKLQVAQATTSQQLQEVLDQLFMAQTAGEAHAILLHS